MERQPGESAGWSHQARPRDICGRGGPQHRGSGSSPSLPDEGETLRGRVPGRWSRLAARPDMEDSLDIAESNTVAVNQREFPGQWLAVDKGAVDGADILDEDSAVGCPDPRVAAAHCRRNQLEATLAADGLHGHPQRQPDAADGFRCLHHERPELRSQTRVRSADRVSIEGWPSHGRSSAVRALYPSQRHESGALIRHWRSQCRVVNAYVTRSGSPLRRMELLQRRCGQRHLVRASRATRRARTGTSFLPVGNITGPYLAAWMAGGRDAVACRFAG